jgi:SAM-dependent methyltransferase
VSADPQYMTDSERTSRARSFGGVAGAYDRGRPSYPPEAISWLLGDAPLEVLDLGAGTGKLTTALLAAGHRVCAVEPLAQMRAVLEQAAPGARALAGTAEQLPLADSSVDAVVVGAAFHWFDQRLALDEIERVLRTPGVLGLLGNAFDVSTAWVASLRGILGPPALDRPGHWPSTQTLGERFEEVGDREFGHSQTVDRARLRDLVLSRSAVAGADEQDRALVFSEVDALWAREDELLGRTEAQVPWIARVRRCRGLR